ncbi:hypothetical protein [uncultured Tateyamaria sp.]|uniref:hypothetical protein n=1 Tax=uncultured Tateyamaria sp. TaxID=455651 RepID=UPI002637E135|nr:hypothetical protein [uncultured Tateyamaria sp.]
MPEVYAWPPVELVGHEHTIDRPVNRSEGISGRPYFSQSKRSRRLVTAQVSGIGTDMAGAGYVEQLKRFLDGKPPFVRMTPLPHVYRRALNGLNLQRGLHVLNWSASGAALAWSDDGEELQWSDGKKITAEAGEDNWPFLDCVDLPPSRPVAYPGELVRSGDAGARVIRLARSDSEGRARIYLDTPLSGGSVLIGAGESIVFEILDYPRAVQPVSGNYTYGFDLKEVFAEEHADGFVEVNPWN